MLSHAVLTRRLLIFLVFCAATIAVAQTKVGATTWVGGATAVNLAGGGGGALAAFKCADWHNESSGSIASQATNQATPCNTATADLVVSMDSCGSGSGLGSSTLVNGTLANIASASSAAVPLSGYLMNYLQNASTQAANRETLVSAGTSGFCSNIELLFTGIATSGALDAPSAAVNAASGVTDTFTIANVTTANPKSLVVACVRWNSGGHWDTATIGATDASATLVQTDDSACAYAVFSTIQTNISVTLHNNLGSGHTGIVSVAAFASN